MIYPEPGTATSPTCLTKRRPQNRRSHAQDKDRVQITAGSNIADAGGGLDEVADLLGHTSISSSQVYLHPDPARLREAVERVPSPRELTETDR